MPARIAVNLSSAEQARLPQQVRRLRLLFPLLRLHILLLLSQGHSPMEIADWLLCSRSSIYEAAACWRQGWRPDQRQEADASSVIRLAPSFRRRLLTLLGKSPGADGWCRTRWSCAIFALSLQSLRGIQVSTETVQLWLHGSGWRWKRTKLSAQDNESARADKLARIRLAAEALRSLASPVVCRRVEHCAAAQEWLSMDAEGHAIRSAHTG